jgi:hypothetical protein
MMIHDKFILGPDHEIIPATLDEWAKWFGENERHVAETDVGKQWVSTVFLGLDHQYGEGPPLLFETMVFNRKPDGEIDFGGEETFRYATWDAAEAGHKAVVKRLEAKLKESVDNG